MKWAIKTWKNMEETHAHITKWKKSIWKDYILNDANYVIFWKWQNYRDIGKTDAEAETPVLWPPHAKNWPIGKDPDAARDWGQQEKGTTEDEMAGSHQRLDEHEFE